MSLEKEIQQLVRPTAEFECLIERIVETAIARIDHVALKPFLTSRECAELIGVTPEHLCSMRARGEGPPWSGAGKWVRYHRPSTIAWLANLPREKASPNDTSPGEQLTANEGDPRDRENASEGQRQ